MWYKSISTSSVKLDYQFDYDLFLEKITEILKKRDNLIGGSKTMTSLSKYDYLAEKNSDKINSIIIESIGENYLKNVEPIFLKNYGIINLKEFWKKHKKLKLEAYYLLSDYIKWNYNLKEKDFDEIFLERFNLEQCSVCHKKSVSNVVFTL